MACQGVVHRHDCPLGVPAEIQQQRCDICRECEHATRNADPKFAAFKGLTSLSVCSLVRDREPDKPALIEIGAAMQKARCPLGKWSAVNSSAEQSQTSGPAEAGPLNHQSDT